MSINYGANSALAPGEAGGVSFGPWTGAHLAPNADLHNASIGTTATLRDPALASRTTMNTYPKPTGPVAQSSTFSNLPGPIQKAMQDLNIPALQAQSARAAMMNRVMGMPNAQLGFAPGNSQPAPATQKTNVNPFQGINYFPQNSPQYNITPMGGGALTRPLSVTKPATGLTVGQQPLGSNANIALPQY